MITRRDVMKAITLGTVGAAVAESVPEVSAWSNIDDPLPPAYAGTRKVKELPYAPNKLQGLDEVMITNHHAKNYTGTVAAINKLEQKTRPLIQLHRSRLFQD